ncbi:hypothetical protein COCON_G00172160 [Conger conger]|uniref:Uncharacterized protein n=1 Tax=Conger conger TaxID=82655 RepID=A0A9Q1D867_CONCO|nr:hypothetical protein COCON_G00172160 [Conger conger]
MGLVMELMERGSVESLLKRLRGPPPWPLAFRLAHQVALGMNFMHKLSPPTAAPRPQAQQRAAGPRLRSKDHRFWSGPTDAQYFQCGGAGGGGGTLSYMPPKPSKHPTKPRPPLTPTVMPSCSGL